MFKKLTSAISSLSVSTPSAPGHRNRATEYVQYANELAAANVSVDVSDCAACEEPCTAPKGEDAAGTIVDGGNIWNGKSYDDYVLDTYGDLGELPSGFDVDWETDLAGSSTVPKGRIVIISTGKSDWERDHTDEKDGLSHKLNKHIQSVTWPKIADKKGDKGSSRPPVSDYVGPAADLTQSVPPSMYSSSLISQSDDPEDQTVLVFPDWKVVHEVENSNDGAKALFEATLQGGLSRGGAKVGEDSGVGRLRSWTMPYRAIVLLCSHKRRDKRCHIAAPLLRSALITCLAKHEITVDETGSSLINLDGPPIEEIGADPESRDAEVIKRVKGIEGVSGGEGGEVGIFNINHLGGHRYAGVMLVMFPSGAYLSYGRVTPQEIPRVVEETILKGKIVPGLLRSAAGVQKENGKGFLGW